MTKLIWHLEENATRKHILEETLSCLSEQQREQVRVAACNAGVPEYHHHDLPAVYQTIDGLLASDRVKRDMRCIYLILAQAEAHAHGCKVEETHFHEVGNGEALRNVASICLAIEALDPSKIVSTSVQTGHGVVLCAHGELSIPAPATAAIIARGIPVCEQVFPGERCTPTSAAVIWHFVQRYDA